jgi:hypothetical protein
MKPRTPPQQIATRSRSSLEAMCVALIRRLDGLAAVRGVEILPLDGDPSANWQLGAIEIDPPLSREARRRVEDAVSSWRQRFRLS